jgi:hypothetical protein
MTAKALAYMSEWMAVAVIRMEKWLQVLGWVAPGIKSEMPRVDDFARGFRTVYHGEEVRIEDINCSM